MPAPPCCNAHKFAIPTFSLLEGPTAHTTRRDKLAADAGACRAARQGPAITGDRLPEVAAWQSNAPSSRVRAMPTRDRAQTCRRGPDVPSGRACEVPVRRKAGDRGEAVPRTNAERRFETSAVEGVLPRHCGPRAPTSPRPISQSGGPSGAIERGILAGLFRERTSARGRGGTGSAHAQTLRPRRSGARHKASFAARAGARLRSADPSGSSANLAQCEAKASRSSKRGGTRR